MIAAGVLMHAGCARPVSHGLDRFLIQRNAAPPTRRQEPPSPSLEESIAKIRKLMAEAHPEPKGNTPPMLEARDPLLKDALDAFAASPTAGNAVTLASVYHRYALFDRAYSYYSRALRLDPKSADAYEGLARVWRDWRLPHLGLGDAVRATYYAPTSASAQNTLGTILLALGRRKEARSAFVAALKRDDKAAYAMNNLCYLSFLDRDVPRAIGWCQQAIRIDPALAAAHNNLGLTYASLGFTDFADEEFTRAGGSAAAAYNMGIVYLARRQYAQAADQFDRVVGADPAVADAAARAREARRLARVRLDIGDQP
jgi:tetratricopeptide (TPR) repeat protein